MENRFCEHCGAKMEPGDNFCLSCGQEIIDTDITDTDVKQDMDTTKPDTYDEPKTLESETYKPGASETHQVHETPETSQIYQTPREPEMSEPRAPSFTQQSSGTNPFRRFSSDMNTGQHIRRSSILGAVLGGIIALTILFIIIMGIIFYLKNFKNTESLSINPDNTYACTQYVTMVEQ